MRTYPKPEVFSRLPHASTVLIEASAGTGKTYTLEYLVVDLLLTEPFPPLERILVVTFTERAASEMRARVRSLIAQLLRGGDSPKAAPKSTAPAWVLNERAVKLLRRALENFDSATICTIHAFCQRLLHEHAFSGRRLFGEELADGQEIFLRAFEAELRERCARDPAFIPYVRAGIVECEGVEELGNFLHRCSREARLGPLFPVWDPEGLANALRQFPSVEECKDVVELLRECRTPDGKKALHGNTVNALRRRLDEIHNIIQEALPLRDGTKLLETCQKLWNLAAQTRSKSNKDSRAHNGEQKSETYLSFLRATLRSVLDAGRSDPDVETIARLLDALDVLSRTIAPPLAAVVHTLLPVVSARTRRIKQEEGLYDFDDMLSLVWETLEQDDGSLGALLRERYLHCLVDEFQDTDPIQWRILQKIFEGRQDQGRLFLIGDPKQAIYDFRGADVYTYIAVRNERAKSKEKPVPLRYCYRSSPRFIEALNAVLLQDGKSALLSSDDITYEHPVESPYASKDSSHEGPRLIGAGGKELAPIVLLDLTVPNSTRKKATLADQIAEEIERLLRDTEIRLVEDGHPRRLVPSDIFVLSRAGYEGREVGKALRKRGIPHAFYKEEGLFQRPEARDVYELLLAISDPRQRERRLRAFLTPFFGVSLKEARWCEDLPDTHPLMKRLLAWHELAQRRDYERLFGRVLAQSGLIRRELFLTEQERALTNYLHLFEFLLETAREEAALLEDLAGVLHAYITGARTPPGREGDVQRLETDAQAVQIMTMHKAKGLEAPIVFLYGIPKTKMHSRHDIAIVHKDGVRCAWFASPVDPEIKERIDCEQRWAEERLAYVAITRAKVRLYIPYGLGEPDDAASRKQDSSRKEEGSADGAKSSSDKKEELSDKDPVSLLNRRLLALEESGELRRLEKEGLIRSRDRSSAYGMTRAEEGQGASEVPNERALTGLCDPPESLLHDPPPPYPFEKLAGERKGFSVTSYSAMKREAAIGETRIIGEEAALMVHDEVHGTEAAGDDVSGSDFGGYVHEMFERVDLRAVANALSFEAWCAQPAVQVLFAGAAKRYGFGRREVVTAQKYVYAGLRTPVALENDGPALPGFAFASDVVREMEFVYPLPTLEEVAWLQAAAGKGTPAGQAASRGHAEGEAAEKNARVADAASRGRLEPEGAAGKDARVAHAGFEELAKLRAAFGKEARAAGRASTADRKGYVQGFIDFVFMHKSKVYFLDWKTEALEDDSDDALRAHVEKHYGLQLRLYVLALRRLLGIASPEEYDAKFGGLMYCFVRKMASGRGGIYSARPSFADVVAWERALATDPLVTNLTLKEAVS